MGELSRLSELTRFAELTRFVYLFPIILTLQLHGKRVVPLSRDPACGLPRNSLRWDENCHVITFCRVGPARRARNMTRACVTLSVYTSFTAAKPNGGSRGRQEERNKAKERCQMMNCIPQRIWRKMMALERTVRLQRSKFRIDSGPNPAIFLNSQQFFLIPRNDCSGKLGR